ncbi:MAG: hypothetical protein WCZ29_01325 [Mycolicibacterium vanbaalenii]|jgi:hypothetical protein|uniref:hypothetical protein n=1 Tax=Mycolicibacterium vanbaalenii TaxID=110539 RepID=UPI00356ADF80
MTLLVCNIPKGWTLLGATIRHRGGQTEEVDLSDIVIIPANGSIAPCSMTPSPS